MPETFTWVPNWVNQVTEKLQDQRGDPETLGRSRGVTVEGYDDSVRFLQEFTLSLNRTDAQEFLAFWRARKGPWQAFKGPSIWIPGSNATSAPHEFTATSTTGLLRFSSDDLEVKWVDPSHCEIDIGLVQTIDGVEGDSYVYLYHIYCEDSAYGYADEYITEWSAPVTTGGYTYAPARIENDEITESVEFQKETAKVNIDIRDSALIRAKVQRLIDANISIDIIEVNYTTGESWDYFSGRLGKIERIERKVTCEVQLWSGVANLQLPTGLKCRTCQHSLFDGGCARINPTLMAMSNWVSRGTYLETRTDAKVVIGTLTFNSKFTSYLATSTNEAYGYFSGGIAITGTGIHTQKRPITFSSFAADSSHTLFHIIPMWPFRTTTGWLTAGDEIIIYPGCDGTLTMCDDKFGNQAAIGSQPFTPAYITEAASTSASTGK